MGDLVSFCRSVNGIEVEQRIDDGFINGTAMAVAHGKKILSWLRTQDTLELFYALSSDLGLEVKGADLRLLDIQSLSAKKYAETFPDLIRTKQGSPAVGGGSWLHPDLALQEAQWCNKCFAIQVSRWVREWITTWNNPIATNVDPDIEWQAWQQRYDIRINLKDVLRPELMNVTAAWAKANGVNPRTYCHQVHDRMNERIQGAKSQTLKLMGGLPLSVLLRDHLNAPVLNVYAGINRLAKNLVVDDGMEPLQAVDKACDLFLGKQHVPQLAEIAENVYLQGHRIKKAKRRKRLQQGIQGSIFDLNQLSS